MIRSPQINYPSLGAEVVGQAKDLPVCACLC